MSGMRCRKRDCVHRDTVFEHPTQDPLGGATFACGEAARWEGVTVWNSLVPSDRPMGLVAFYSSGVDAL